MQFNDTQSIDTVMEKKASEKRVREYSDEELNEWKDWAESWIHEVDSNKGE